MSTAVACPGSFDPVTLGHLDVIERMAARFDRVVVATLSNEGKNPLFTVDERLGLLREVVAHLPRVEVVGFEGLLVDFCRAHEVGIIAKGLRAAGDFEYEQQMAQMNRAIGGVETIFVTTSPEYAFLSSSLVKEVARYGADISGFVPQVVADRLREKLAGPQRPG